MTTLVYKNDYEFAISIKFGNQRIDFCIPKGQGTMIVALYEDGRGDAVGEITLPILPGMAVLGSFFGDLEVIMEMAGIEIAPERHPSGQL